MPFADGHIRPLSRPGPMTALFGKPCDDSQIELVTLPIIGKAYLHRRVAAAFVAVFTSILDAGAAHLIDRDSYGGTYCCRNVRGSSAKSPHSWAVAIDLNTDHLQQGAVEVRGSSNFKCRPEQVPASLKALEPFFTAWGFTWGGFWRSYLDPMHFEATEYTVELAEGRATFVYDVLEAINYARAKVNSGLVTVPHDPPLVIGPDQQVVAEGKMLGDRLWAPVRDVAKALGGDVTWHNEQGKAYLTKGPEVPSE